MTLLASQFQTATNQGRTDPAALKARQHSQRRQGESRNRLCIGDYCHLGEQNVSHDLRIAFRHQRKPNVSARAQGIDEVRFVLTAEGGGVDVVDRVNVGGRFRAEERLHLMISMIRVFLLSVAESRLI